MRDLKTARQPFFIVNPQSRTVKRKGSVLQKVADTQDIPIILSQSTSDLTVIISAAQDTGADWFFIEGGDGTVQATLTAFFQTRDHESSPPWFSILPGGMTNQICRHIGIRRATKKRVTDLVGGATPVHKPMPLIQIDLPDTDPKFGFLFSSGALPMATEYYFENVHKDGKMGAGAVAKMIAKGFGGSEKLRSEIYKPSEMNLVVSGDKSETYLDGEHLGTVVTTLPGLMLGLDPFWGEGEAPLRLTYVKGDAQHILRHLISLWAGQKKVSRQDDGIESFAANVLSYDYKGPVVLDGETLDVPGHHLTLRATQPIDFLL